MGQHVIELQLSLAREKAERAYLKRLLEFLVEEIGRADTHAEWAALAVDEELAVEFAALIVNARRDLPNMLKQMALHLRLEILERAASRAAGEQK